MLLRNRKTFHFLFIVGFLFLGSMGCASLDGNGDRYYRNSCYSYNCDYTNQGYNYRAYRSYNNYPQYRSSGGGNGGHNPFHVPSGRFHNVGRPSGWKL